VRNRSPWLAPQSEACPTRDGTRRRQIIRGATAGYAADVNPIELANLCSDTIDEVANIAEEASIASAATLLYASPSPSFRLATMTKSRRQFAKLFTIGFDQPHRGAVERPIG
jgi:hypothetical protein